MSINNLEDKQLESAFNEVELRYDFYINSERVDFKNFYIKFH